MINICYDDRRCILADVAELVDALDLGSSVFGREGSSPFIRIALALIRDKDIKLNPRDCRG